jgi:copper chaperone CopZ
MKKLMILTVALATAFTFTASSYACGKTKNKNQAQTYMYKNQYTKAQINQAKKVQVSILGLSSSKSAKMAGKSILKLDGALKAAIDVQNGSAQIYFAKSTEVSFAKIKKAIEQAGFIAADVDWAQSV